MSLLDLSKQYDPTELELLERRLLREQSQRSEKRSLENSLAFFVKDRDDCCGTSLPMMGRIRAPWVSCEA
jgi:hypothetical protein